MVVSKARICSLKIDHLYNGFCEMDSELVKHIIDMVNAEVID